MTHRFAPSRPPRVSPWPTLVADVLGGVAIVAAIYALGVIL